MVVVIRFMNENKAQIQVDGRIKFAFLGVAGIVLLVITLGVAYLSKERDLKVIFMLLALLLLTIPIVSAFKFLRSVYIFEIDKALQSVRRLDARGMSELRAVGGFHEVALISTLTPGKQKIALHKLRVVCEFGVVELFTLTSKSATLKNGHVLANWLAVPFKDTGWSPYSDFIDDTKLFPAN